MFDRLSSQLKSQNYDYIRRHFEPKSLTIGRELRGYTKAHLASLIEKTPGAISQFENAQATPDISTIKLLSLALGVPADFFLKRFDGDLISIDNCHFRSLRSATQKSRRQVLANAKVLNELIFVLQEYVDFPDETITLTTRELGDPEDIEKFASEVRKFWGLKLGPIPHLFKLLESKGVIISYISHENEKVDAFSFWQSKRPYIFLIPNKNSPSRTRFDCAHELGHLLMHADVSPGNSILEAEANRFAAAFLVPRQTFLQECPKRLSFKKFYELKQRWKVSVAALIRRAYDLECISEYAYKRAFVELNKRKERYNEPFEPVRERPVLLDQAFQILREDNEMGEASRRLKLSTNDLEEIVSQLRGDTIIPYGKEISANDIAVYNFIKESC